VGWAALLKLPRGIPNYIEKIISVDFNILDLLSLFGSSLNRIYLVFIEDEEFEITFIWKGM
jgi:hypothetical protein